MTGVFVPFDAVWDRIVETVGSGEAIPEQARPVYLVRNLYGQVGVSVSEVVAEDPSCRDALERLADRLRVVLGAHGPSAKSGVLFVGESLLRSLGRHCARGVPRVLLADRLVTGGDWWTVRDQKSNSGVRRCTLFSVKGGVGRSTTAAVLAWHLARRGERVLLADLDLESPGLSSAMLDSALQPALGITDWFVEDLVGQGERVIERMIATPPWAEDSDGTVHVAPAHGREPGEYLAKLGRVYMDNRVGWTARLAKMLSRLEETLQPTVVLLESRSGLHDIAAATVTDLDADVMLFAVDAMSHWTDYEALFRHWQSHGVATSIRDRLSIVSALTPEWDTEWYLQRFREKSWNLFRDGLYGPLELTGDVGDPYSFDLDEEDAPHTPLPIHWTRGLAAGASLVDLQATTVFQAYGGFLRRFDGLVMNDGGGRR